MAEEYAQLTLLDDESFDENASYRSLTAFPRRVEAPAPFIKRLQLENLKGFEHLGIEFGKFNVLVGPNNCGKSTVLQAIDLCFRLMQYHAEFQRNVLVKPQAGKRVVDEMLPVADRRDFWFQRRIRRGNKRIPVTLVSGKSE